MKDAGKAAAPTHLFDLKKGQYSDGSPLDEVHYLESKIILKPDRFTSAKVFLEFGELIQGACRKCGVAFSRKGVVLKPQLREVLFLDTADFTLYKNAFILRRRILYQDGFPVGDPEIVFKFRHPDIQTAAEMDVRPDFAGDYRIKFKAEGLPLHDQVGGCRLLFSHNAQFGLSQMPEAALSSMSALARTLPALRALKAPGAERVGIVNDTIVEEVQQNLGSLDLGAASSPRRMSHSGANGRRSGRSALNSRSKPSSSAATRCTTRQWTGSSSCSSTCSNRRAIGFTWAQRKQGWSTASKEATRQTRNRGSTPDRRRRIA
jgi:hypothetical protein